MASPRHTVEKTHKSSSPNRPENGSGPGKPRTLDNLGGPTLRVQDNANVRGDGFLNPPVKNESPAIAKSYPSTNP